MNAISINNVCMSYGKVRALQNISFDVLPGELFGLIGPDGAGKTSLFRILTTLLLADSGTMTVTDLMHEANAEQLEQQDKILHEIELLQAIYKMKFITNN